MKVEGAETIWDKVTEETITFESFMDILSNNLLVGVSKLTVLEFTSLKSDIDLRILSKAEHIQLYDLE